MLTEMVHPPASVVVRTRSLDLVRQLCGVLGHCLLKHPLGLGQGQGQSQGQGGLRPTVGAQMEESVEFVGGCS